MLEQNRPQKLFKAHTTLTLVRFLLHGTYKRLFLTFRCRDEMIFRLATVHPRIGVASHEGKMSSKVRPITSHH